jgi:hypothetical protein
LPVVWLKYRSVMLNLAAAASGIMQNVCCK